MITALLAALSVTAATPPSPLAANYIPLGIEQLDSSRQVLVFTPNNATQSSGMALSWLMLAPSGGDIYVLAYLRETNCTTFATRNVAAMISVPDVTVPDEIVMVTGEAAKWTTDHRPVEAKAARIACGIETGTLIPQAEIGALLGVFRGD